MKEPTYFTDDEEPEQLEERVSATEFDDLEME